jgi:hypothetical protein
VGLDSGTLKDYALVELELFILSQSKIALLTAFIF